MTNEMSTLQIINFQQTKSEISSIKQNNVDNRINTSSNASNMKKHTLFVYCILKGRIGKNLLYHVITIDIYVTKRFLEILKKKNILF